MEQNSLNCLYKNDSFTLNKKILLRQWHKMGIYCHKDKLFCLTDITKESFITLSSDRLLAEIVVSLAKSKYSNVPTQLARICANAETFFLPSLFPELVRQKTSSLGTTGLWVDADIATSYIIATRHRAIVEDWNDRDNHLIYHRLLSLPNEVTSKDVSFARSELQHYFTDYETVLYDSHSYRFLHLIGDDLVWDFLLCLETGAIGISPLFFGEDYLATASFDLRELEDLAFFKDRLYIPIWYLDLYIYWLQKQTLDSSYQSFIECLNKVKVFWEAFFNNFFQRSNLSYKLAVIYVLEQLGYSSPFGVQ